MENVEVSDKDLLDWQKEIRKLDPDSIFMNDGTFKTNLLFTTIQDILSYY